MYIPLLPSSTAPIILSDGGLEVEFAPTPTGYVLAAREAAIRPASDSFSGEVTVSQAGVILARIFAEEVHGLTLERRGPDGVLHGMPFEALS